MTNSMKLYKGMKLRVLRNSPIGIRCLKEGDIITVKTVGEGGEWTFEDDNDYWYWVDGNDHFEDISKSYNFNELYSKLNSI